MKIAEISEKLNMSNYITGLMSTEPSKTCSSIARVTEQSHDALSYQFKNESKNAEDIREDLKNFSRQAFKDKKTFLILDDSRLSKPHARTIEGLDVGYDSSTGRPSIGLQMVEAIMSDGDLKIPINTDIYTNKDIAGNYYRTKSEIARALYNDIKHSIDINMLLADAHYATKDFLGFLRHDKQRFLMRFPCNRIVKINGKLGQLRDILKLKKNSHTGCAKGTFDGAEYYFYVVTIDSERKAYYISFDYIDSKAIRGLYKIRWGVEMFNRTAKQSLGWNDCQMRAIEKHILHTLCVMHAYAQAELERVKKKLKTTEEAIRALWIAKSSHTKFHNLRSRRNFELCA